MTERKRVGALLLCIGMILILSVSAAFILHEADHDCTGEDCPICRNIAVRIRLLRTAALAVAALAAFGLLLAALTACARWDRYVVFCPATLVRWKIRLND